MRGRAGDDVSTPLLRGGVAACILAAWGCWAAIARISVYEVSEAARLEVDQARHPLDASVAGRIRANRLVLGQRVSAGDVLVELDGAVALQRLAEARAKHEALATQLEARRVEMAAEEELRGRTHELGIRAVDEARAHRDQAEVGATFAAEQLSRLERLFRARAVAEVDVLRARADAAEKAAGLEEARRSIVRVARKQESDESVSALRIAHLATETRDLAATDGTTAAVVSALEHELEEHTLRAPVSGEIAEVSLRGVGAFVERGERLATIVPVGAIVAVGSFAPASVIGRVHAGQSARLRFDGFPWAQYGSMPATVSRAGTEVRDGRVRVELTLAPDGGSAIPLQHGLPGQVEVEVERISPLSLLLRLGGKALSGDKRPRDLAPGPP